MYRQVIINKTMIIKICIYWALKKLRLKEIMKSQKLVLHQNNQVLPINQNILNFQANIKVESVDNAPFYALVIEQHQLADVDKLTFKNVSNGVLSIELSNEKDTFESWYLVLRADKETEVSITIDVVKISLLQPTSMATAKVSKPFLFKHFNWKWIGGIIACIVVIIAGYFYFKKRPTPITISSQENMDVPLCDIQQSNTSMNDIQPDMNEDDILYKISQLPEI